MWILRQCRLLCRERRGIVKATIALIGMYYVASIIGNISIIYEDQNCIRTVERTFLGNSEDELQIRIPPIDDLQTFSKQEIACLYHRYVTTLQDFCTEPTRFGEVETGGIHFCVDNPYLANQEPCIIYSFDPKLNYSFGIQMHRVYNCDVYIFHKWKFIQNSDIKFVRGSLGYNTPLSWYQKSLRHNMSRSIDMVTLSVRYSDEQFVNKMATDGDFDNVKQLSVYINLNSYIATSQQYLQMLSILKIFNNLGFRIFWFDRPWECAPLMGKFSHCYYVFMKRSYPLMQRDVFKPISLLPPAGVRPNNYVSSQDLDRYFRYITSQQYLCKQIVRIGNIKDGGWEVCNDINFRPVRNNCLIYSFGINYDWSFDDDVTNEYGCELHAFDPSMSVKSHQRSHLISFYDEGLSFKKITTKVRGKEWRLSDLNSIVNKLGHRKRVIDILKIDIESSEKMALPAMIKSGVLENVVQLLVEFHNYRDLVTLRRLYEMGFRIFWSHQNHYSKAYRNNTSVAKAMEVYFVNVNKMRKSD